MLKELKTPHCCSGVLHFRHCLFSCLTLCISWPGFHGNMTRCVIASLILWPTWVVYGLPLDIPQVELQFSGAQKQWALVMWMSAEWPGDGVRWGSDQPGDAISTEGFLSGDNKYHFFKWSSIKYLHFSELFLSKYPCLAGGGEPRCSGNWKGWWINQVNEVHLYQLTSPK